MISHYAGQYEAVADIFFAAIHQTATEYYSEAQVNAWAPLPIDYEAWHWRLELKRPFLFMQDKRVAGFIELDPDGHIDCHYVAPTFSRQGIGGKLLEHVIQIATERKLERLYVEASHLAKGLYLKKGFQVIRENQVQRNEVTLENWIMQRTF